MDSVSPYLVLLPILLLAAVIAGISGEKFYTPSGPVEEVEVTDCRNQSFTCEQTIIERKPSSCAKWHPWDPRSEINCNYTSQGLESVTLVTDPANYIEAPMTSMSYNASVHRDTIGNIWDLEFLPSGDMLWTRLPGGLYRTVDGDKEKVAEFDTPETYKAGLMGLAIDPDFERNRYIYLFYTDSKKGETEFFGMNAWNNRVSRFKLVDGELRDEKILMRIEGGDIHNGGRLEFGPDGKLYAATGEAFARYKASKRSFTGGKIHRINTDGTIPDDNPFPNSTVYSMGHRNPQGIAWNPETGTLYNSEHGQWRNDEINRVLPGGKYGWSGYICDKKLFFGAHSETVDIPLEQFYDNTPPVHCFSDWTIAPSGMTFVNQSGHPWHGDLFVAGLRGKQVHRFEFEGDEIVRNEIFYVSDDEEEVGLRMRDVEFFNGSLYSVGVRGGIAELTPADEG